MRLWWRQRPCGERFNVKAVAALDGPYSLSRTMKDLMVNANPGYKAPYFLPYLINGYDAAYYTGPSEGNKIDDFNFMNVVLNDVPGVTGNYAEQLRALLDGSHTPDQVNALLSLSPRTKAPEVFCSRRPSMPYPIPTASS